MENVENRLRAALGDMPPFSFGAWALGGEYWGDQAHSDSVRAVHRALALGVTHFDTAPVYGKGRSEQILGQQLRKIRSEVTLATKVFYSTPEKMVESFHSSLKRLMTDYIDIFYIHWPLSGCDMRPGMETLMKLKEEGRIRALGLSNFSSDQIEMVQEAGEADVFQGGYNILFPELEKELLPFLQERGIAFIPYGVLAQGILTDRGLEHLEKEHQGFRHKMVLYSPEIRERVKSLVDELLKACREAGFTVEQAVSEYSRRRTGAATVLLGVRNRKQAELNFDRGASSLPKALTGLMDRITREGASLVPGSPNLFNHIS